MEINTSDEIIADEITISVQFPMKLSDVLEQFQATILEKAFERHNGNRTHMANSLGLNRTTLISKAKRHGVIPPTAEE
jgi:DNA-binding NtrC family response regulator